MESQHMTQQTFAQFIGMSPASLSSIFNGRTQPTIKIVEAIKSKIPKINTDWILFGTGEMFISDNVSFPAPSPENTSDSPLDSVSGTREPALEFDDVPSVPSSAKVERQTSSSPAHSTKKSEVEAVKIIDKQPRKITEIRIFYDDQTWETFVPQKR